MGQVVKLHDYASETDARLSASILALVSGQHVDPKDVARELKVSKAAYYRKINGSSPWKASEIETLAKFFGVRLGDLYDGLGGRVGPTPQGPLAQSVELRTFNPKSPMADNAKLGRLIPFPTSYSPQDLPFVMGS